MDAQNFQEKVKDSFSNVKKDINELKNELNELKNDFYPLKEEISKILSLIEKRSKILSKNGIKIDPNTSSADEHARTHSRTHALTHSLDTHINIYDLQQIDQTFKKLTKKEFLIFLTIYQLEEDLNNPVDYKSIANHLKVTEAGIRSYISSLIKKRVPIEKIKLNNRVAVLSIDKEFRALRLKSKLIDIYSQLDTNQTRLTGL